MKNENTLQEQIELVEEAQNKLFEAIELLEEYIELSDDRSTNAYILDHLVIMASRDHGFLSRDRNLDEVLESLQEQLKGE